MKAFLSAGDVLINPALLAFAAVETDSDGVRLRLWFTGPCGDGGGTEVLLEGLEARSVLRWLRNHSEFLDSGRPSRWLDRPAASVKQGQEQELGTSCCRSRDLIVAAS